MLRMLNPGWQGPQMGPWTWSVRQGTGSQQGSGGHAKSCCPVRTHHALRTAVHYASLTQICAARRHAAATKDVSVLSNVGT